MGAGFHSVGRGIPDEQVTLLTDNVLTTVVPTPPAGIARVIGLSEAPFNADVGGNLNLHNPAAAATLNLEVFIAGPEGTFQIDGVTALAALASNRSVISQSVVIQAGETVRAQIPVASASSEANIVSSWVDYRMDDVLKLRRVVFNSGVSTAFQDVLPAPPLGSRHTFLGNGERSSIIVGSAEGTLGVQFRFNDNGVLTPMGTQTPVEFVANELVAPPQTVGPTQRVEGAAVDGSAIAYISFLKVPANP